MYAEVSVGMDLFPAAWSILLPVVSLTPKKKDSGGMQLFSMKSGGIDKVPSDAAK